MFLCSLARAKPFRRLQLRLPASGPKYPGGAAGFPAAYAPIKTAAAPSTQAPALHVGSRMTKWDVSATTVRIVTANA